MHLYIMTRGIKHDVDRFINELSAKYLPYKFKGKPAMLQFSVRPIQLYELVFPEEQRDIVLNTILQSGNGKTQHKKHEKFIYGIRKILGVKPIPEYNKKVAKMPLYMANTEIVGIGVKEDYWRDDKTDERIEKITDEKKKTSYEAI